MFFGLPYSVQAIGLFFLIQTFLLIKQGINPLRKINKLLIIPILFYAIHIISLIYSENIAEANFDLQVKFSFLALPIIFALKKEEDKTDFFKLIKSYTIIALIAGIAYIIKGYFHAGSYPHYMVFSHPLHPSYLALYFTVNIAFAAIILLKKKEFLWVQIISILISFSILYIAESKAGLIATFAIIVFFLYKVIFHKNKKLSISIIFLFTIIAGCIIIFVPRFKTLITTTFNFEKVYAHPEKVVESTGLRLLAWKASLDIIRENPIIGVGAGDIKDELAIIYTKKNYKKPLELKMNCHNQYLETLVGQGIIGLTVLLLLIIALFVNKNHKLISQLFAIIIGTNILFESMFNVQAGVVFFVFIYSMIISSKKHILIP